MATGLSYHVNDVKVDCPYCGADNDAELSIVHTPMEAGTSTSMNCWNCKCDFLISYFTIEGRIIRINTHKMDWRK